MLKKRYNKKDYNSKIVNISAAIVVLVLTTLTIGFSAFQSTGIIKDIGATVRVQKNIRITGVSVMNPVSEGVSNYEDYNVESITSGLSLPNANSKITYKVEITNFGNAEMMLTEISGLPSNLKYTIDEENYRLNELICDDNDDTKCTLGAKKTLYVTVGYKNSASYDSSTTTYPISMVFTFESTDKVAEVNGIYYDTLQEAITKGVPKDNTETTVRLLKNTSEAITVAQKQNIIFDFQNSVLRNNGNTNVIVNNGTIKITNGIISSNAATNGAINNNSTGKITISGGSIVATGGRQALYNDKGTAEITGTAYLSSAATERAAVQNQASGTLKITGGTIVSTGSNAVDNRGNMTIGVEDGNIDESTPVMQGVKYGITATANYNFYNGTAKGKITGIDNDSYVVGKEEGYNIGTSEEIIGGELYRTAFLAVTSTVTFDPNGGTTLEPTRGVPIGKKVGTLPDATRTGYEFEGWYTDATEGDKIGSNRAITEDVTFYAHWKKIYNVLMNGNYYGTIQDAVTAAPTGVATTVKLLRDTSEYVTIPKNKNIIFDFENHTVSNVNNARIAIIENNGTITISNGTLTSSADAAVINNNSGGRVTISGGNIIATGEKQAIYNLSGGYVEITGTAYLSSKTSGSYNGMDRSTAQNLSGGTMVVTGGTIVGIRQEAITNAGTLTIGVDDGNVNTTSPVIIGETYGLKSSTSFSFYDGVIKGINNPSVSGTLLNSDVQIVEGTETIDGKTYNTATVEST